MSELTYKAIYQFLKKNGAKKAAKSLKKQITDYDLEEEVSIDLEESKII